MAHDYLQCIYCGEEMELEITIENREEAYVTGCYKPERKNCQPV